jgi:hypothetical protein
VRCVRRALDEEGCGDDFSDMRIRQSIQTKFFYEKGKLEKEKEREKEKGRTPGAPSVVKN